MEMRYAIMPNLWKGDFELCYELCRMSGYCRETFWSVVREMEAFGGRRICWGNVQDLYGTTGQIKNCTSSEKHWQTLVILGL